MVSIISLSDLMYVTIKLLVYVVPLTTYLLWSAFKQASQHKQLEADVLHVGKQRACQTHLFSFLPCVGVALWLSITIRVWKQCYHSRPESNWQSRPLTVQSASDCQPQEL